MPAATKDDVTNLARRAAEHQNKLMTVKINQSMKQNPACITHLDNSLRAIGMHIDQCQNGIGDGQRGSGAINASRATFAAKAKAKAKAEEKNQCEKRGEIMTCSVERMSIQILKKALTPAAPVGLSAPNLNAWLRRMSADQAQEELLKIYEFVTGRSRTTDTKGEMKVIKNFTDDSVEQSALRGNRGNTLRLPPVWPDDGVCQIIDCTPVVYSPHSDCN